MYFCVRASLGVYNTKEDLDKLNSSIEEKTPMAVVPAEDKVWESSLGGNLEIPIKFITTSEIKDKVTIVPVGFPGMGKAPQIQVAKDKTTLKFVMILHFCAGLLSILRGGCRLCKR